MSPIALEDEDHNRDATFNKILHGKSAEEKAGFRAMLKKDPAAQKAAIDEYFKHWDNKVAGAETAEIREVCARHLTSRGGNGLNDAIGATSRIRNPHQTVRLQVVSSCKSPSLTLAATTTSRPISMSMAGAPLSISADSPMGKASTRPSLVMNIILPT